MKKQVFIINGSGGVGKDAFVITVGNQNIKLIAEERDISYYQQWLEVGNYSSVSKVKQIAKMIGWNGGKTERDRKFLSDLKLLTTEYNDMPLNDMKKIANDFFCCGDVEAKILFLHIREPLEIERAVNEFKEYNAKTILVKRNSVKHITSNMADENVYNYNYDIVINNDGNMNDLEVIAKKFLKDFENNDFKKEY